MTRRYPVHAWVDITAAILFLLALAAIGMTELGWWP